MEEYIISLVEKYFLNKTQKAVTMKKKDEFIHLC